MQDNLTICGSVGCTSDIRHRQSRTYQQHVLTRSKLKGCGPRVGDVAGAMLVRARRFDGPIRGGQLGWRVRDGQLKRAVSTAQLGRRRISQRKHDVVCQQCAPVRKLHSEF